MEHLNLETAPRSSNDDKDLNDDDIDFWGEDETLDTDTNEASSHSSFLNREWKRRHEQFHTMGYRDGITAGKEASAQEGFNVGFKQSVHSGYNWGLVRGISSAYINLSDDLKEKLARTVEKRERLRNLYQSSHKISTMDALKMYHESIQRAETKQEPSESSSQISSGDNGELSMYNQLDDLFKELISIQHDSPEIDLKIEQRREIPE
ncbi:uncharacterized protein A4U43_C02F18720 [Asparagus officinalis]|uniref:Essential protein Yae1 N-terminal domain-containing protein n=1 Tax=Asparagus officinalis TaxID=4686 RepID=A0A5P1FK38_ASPOF|nr:yae1 domain-containing protein 1-like [Asparagus officinalis]ONK78434.1 uncharacterized protein A4U43_C02F18720 [Asparagus officinalis]